MRNTIIRPTNIQGFVNQVETCSARNLHTGKSRQSKGWRDFVFY